VTNSERVVATTDELVTRACERSGLSDFGSSGWEEGLEQLVAGVAADIGRDAQAVATVEEMIITRLVNRLGVEHWYAEHGHELAEPVQGPVAIVGLPRTATTALQFLLAVDPQFRYARPWEVNAPVPPPELANETADPRRLAASSRPSVRHIASVDGPIEDNPLLGLHFHSQELGLPVPTYTTWWRDAEFEEAFAYYDRVLRLLHSRRPPYRWLVKGPAYLFLLDVFARRYPNVRFLMTHRDPAVALPSTCSTVIDAWSLVVPTVTVEQEAVGRFLLEHYVDATRRAISARRDLGEHRFLVVSQQDVERDAVGTAERIYAFLDLELTDDVRATMTEFAHENRRGARGEHAYTAEEFGYTVDGIRTAFSEYLDRFGALATPGS
jgi:Sulfotransferase family